jgi:hypothetical protein
MAADGVQTLFLETGDYRQRTNLVRPQALGRFLDAAHVHRPQVVAWYLPSLADPRRDLRGSLAAIRYQSPSGERFDSFALDIEASVVKRRGRFAIGFWRCIRIGPAGSVLQRVAARDAEAPVSAAIAGGDVTDGARPQVLVALRRAVAGGVGHADERDVAGAGFGIVFGGEEGGNAPPVGAAHRLLAGVDARIPGR